MPLLRVNAMASGAGDAPCVQDAGLQVHGTMRGPSGCLADRRMAAGPATILIHGYKYAPYHPRHCPHQRIFGVGGWLGALGADDGLTVAFGWQARGALRGAHARGLRRGMELARLVRMLRAHDPARRVNIVAHSLGASVAMAALPYLKTGDISRIILLTGACHRDFAGQALASDAGRTAQVLNVTSRENDVFDFAFERLVPGSGAIGRGLLHDNVVDMQIDCARTLPALALLGHRVAPARRRVCHWSAYTRPGLLAFYGAFLRDPDALPLAHLRAALPATAAPRWSRLLAAPPLAAALKTRIMARTKPEGPPHEHAY